MTFSFSLFLEIGAWALRTSSSRTVLLFPQLMSPPSVSTRPNAVPCIWRNERYFPLFFFFLSFFPHPICKSCETAYPDSCSFLSLFAVPDGNPPLPRPVQSGRPRLLRDRTAHTSYPSHYRLCREVKGSPTPLRSTTSDVFSPACSHLQRFFMTLLT